MFLMSLRKAGLVFYVSKETIGTVSFETSSWFTGRDNKYFFARGAYYEATHKKTAFLWEMYSALRIRNSKLSFVQRIKCMRDGQKAYNNFQSYDEFMKNK